MQGLVVALEAPGWSYNWHFLEAPKSIVLKDLREEGCNCRKHYWHIFCNWYHKFLRGRDTHILILPLRWRWSTLVHHFIIISYVNNNYVNNNNGIRMTNMGGPNFSLLNFPHYVLINHVTSKKDKKKSIICLWETNQTTQHTKHDKRFFFLNN